MQSDSKTPLPLAPLQRQMVADTLNLGAGSAHVEQVEIRFLPHVETEQVIGAWNLTAIHTKALRMAFIAEDQDPVGWCPVATIPAPEERADTFSCWSSWMMEDRNRPLISPGEVPWRVTWWPEERRLVWTFHHALLDGRSIASILRHFLKRMGGEKPAPLSLSKWKAPTSELLKTADLLFRATFAEWKSDAIPLLQPETEGPRATRKLGVDFIPRIEGVARKMEVSMATVLIQAWGQTLAEAAGMGAMLVEQVRSGSSHEGTAGFLMNTKPVLIRSSPGQGSEYNLRELRGQLIALREIETVSIDDLEAGVAPSLDDPRVSVVMIERGTLRHMVGEDLLGQWVDTIALHEETSQALTALAYIQPDLCLEVEGPGRHRLLDGWVGSLEKLCG